MTKKDPEQEKQPSEAKDTKESQSKEDEYKEMLQRLQAEFENYKKRQEKELGQQKQAALALFVAKLLPVLDSFEQAVKAAEKEDAVSEGFGLIYLQLSSMLEGQGLRKIEALGKQFDTSMHEAMMTDSQDGKPNNIITEEFQQGYTFNGIVLRHSKVRVNKKVAVNEHQ
ncbi:nucleotide exchange factor GrpE [Candidatus Woesearchaeota archaeon]|nr:nucleotide exchange factor GrpE [Candidatus Woesearchaeota archaeon]